MQKKFVSVLEVTDDKQDPDPDPLVRGMDPRIQIDPEHWIESSLRISNDSKILTMESSLQ
jgi:hypothetical protein